MRVEDGSFVGLLGFSSLVSCESSAVVWCGVGGGVAAGGCWAVGLLLSSLSCWFMRNGSSSSIVGC